MNAIACCECNPSIHVTGSTLIAELPNKLFQLRVLMQKYGLAYFAEYSGV
jgi:hypothetical protein